MLGGFELESNNHGSQVIIHRVESFATPDSDSIPILIVIFCHDSIRFPGSRTSYCRADLNHFDRVRHNRQNKEKWRRDARSGKKQDGDGLVQP